MRRGVQDSTWPLAATRGRSDPRRLVAAEAAPTASLRDRHGNPTDTDSVSGLGRRPAMRRQHASGSLAQVEAALDAVQAGIQSVHALMGDGVVGVEPRHLGFEG